MAMPTRLLSEYATQALQKARPVFALSPPDQCVLIADRDGDGIPDSEDKCPDNPENYTGLDDSDGCPRDTCPIDPEDLTASRTATVSRTWTTIWKMSSILMISAPTRPDQWMAAARRPTT
jgi:hypothetical protein